MLPEDDLYEDELDSSENEDVYESDGGSSDEDRNADASAPQDGGSSGQGSPTSRRHSTYYHHPERSRKRMMPGAFTQ